MIAKNLSASRGDTPSWNSDLLSGGLLLDPYGAKPQAPIIGSLYRTWCILAVKYDILWQQLIIFLWINWPNLEQP